MTKKTDYSSLTVQDAIQGISETKRALERCEELLEKVTAMGTAKPRVYGLLADSTDRLRMHLAEDLAALEDALQKAEAS